jgi:hypothetical protein
MSGVPSTTESLTHPTITNEPSQHFAEALLLARAVRRSTTR